MQLYLAADNASKTPTPEFWPGEGNGVISDYYTLKLGNYEMKFLV